MAGLAVNLALLFVLVPRGGAGLGIAGAGIALCGAYVAMLAVIYTLTRNLFSVGFEWARLALLGAILGGVAISGELLLPDPRPGRPGRAHRLARAGPARAAARLASSTPTSGRRPRSLAGDARGRVVAFRAGHGEVEAYAEDPLRDL